GAPNVPGISAGPQVGIPHSAGPVAQPFSPPGAPGAIPQGVPGGGTASPPAPGGLGGGGGGGGGGSLGGSSGGGGYGGGSGSGPGNSFPGNTPTLPGTPGGLTWIPPGHPVVSPQVGRFRPPTTGPRPKRQHVPRFILPILIILVLLLGGVSTYLVV